MASGPWPGNVVSRLIEACAENHAVLKTYEEQVLLSEMDKYRDIASQHADVAVEDLKYALRDQVRAPGSPRAADEH
jgi:hypothetical protein